MGKNGKVNQISECTNPRNSIHNYLIACADNVRNHIRDHEKKQEWNTEVSENHEICYNFADISSPDRERAKCALIFIHKSKYNIECKSHFTFPDTIILSKGKHGLINSHITALSSLGDYFRKDLARALFLGIILTYERSYGTNSG